MASLASLGEDYLHLLFKRNYITERSKKKYEVLSLQLSLLKIVSAHHLLLFLYDTKPVHFLPMAVDNIRLTEKKREVYDRYIGRMTKMKFLRLNVNNDYRYGMGGADIADQIRGSYRFDHWLRTYKWWRAIFW